MRGLLETRCQKHTGGAGGENIKIDRASYSGNNVEYNAQKKAEKRKKAKGQFRLFRMSSLDN